MTEQEWTDFLARTEGHTPGPWDIVRVWSDIHQIGPIGSEVCTSFGEPWSRISVSNADAAFVAAAPTLKDEVTRLRDGIKDIKEAWDWWQVDPHDRCASVVCDAIDKTLKGGER